ncbi:MAG: tetratricopeptide repeat protein [Gammaproteobacteria bacterium]|nr:tetratricopeptide repeat protein [Gammaproteobacteria bacterium]
MRALVLTLLMLALVGCAEGVGAPVAAGFDSAEAELAEYLEELHGTAREFPDSGPMRGRLGLAYDANGFAEAAAATYAQAQVLEGHEFLWPYLRAFAVASGGDLDEAVRAVDAALAIDAAYAPAWLQRATWLLDLDRLDDASAAFERALELAPRGDAAVAASAGIARVHLRQDRADEAIASLEPLIARYDYPQLHRLLGLAFRAAGRASDATEATARGKDAPPLQWRDERREATEDHVRGFHGRLGLAETILQRGDAHRAASMLESLRESRPDDRTLINNLSIAYQRRGQPDQAISVLRDGLTTHPDYALFHFNIASLFEEAGRPASAVEHFARAAELDPGLVAAHERRAMLLMRQGQLAAARESLEAMVPLGGATSAFHHAAMIAGSRGRWPSAIELLQRAVELDPAFTRGHVFLGRALAEAGHHAEARAALNRADDLGTHPDDVAAARDRLAELDTDTS